MILSTRLCSSDAYYLICSKIDNHLSEDILFDNQTIKSLQSSIISSKQQKIQLKTFPSDLPQLLSILRSLLPNHLHYRTINSVCSSLLIHLIEISFQNKHLRVPIDWQSYSEKKFSNHLSDLIQSPYRCFWHFERLSQTFHIHLCVQSKSYSLDKLEFLFFPSEDCRFLNSNKILFVQVS